MTFSVPRVRHYLREFALEKLFVEELGWDRSSGRLTVQADGHSYALHALAEKRGVQIFQCQPDAQGNIPDYASRRIIEKQVTKSAYEHLLIYIDTAKTMQVLAVGSAPAGSARRLSRTSLSPSPPVG